MSVNPSSHEEKNQMKLTSLQIPAWTDREKSIGNIHLEALIRSRNSSPMENINKQIMCYKIRESYESMDSITLQCYKVAKTQLCVILVAKWP